MTKDTPFLVKCVGCGERLRLEQIDEHLLKEHTPRRCNANRQLRCHICFRLVRITNWDGHARSPHPLAECYRLEQEFFHRRNQGRRLSNGSEKKQ